MIGNLFAREISSAMGVTAETADLKIEVARVERVTQARRGLGRPLEGEHAQAQRKPSGIGVPERVHFTEF